MSAKTFNTAGLCDPERHYMLPPERRLGDIDRLIGRAGSAALPEAIDLVQRGKGELH